MKMPAGKDKAAPPICPLHYPCHGLRIRLIWNRCGKNRYYARILRLKMNVIIIFFIQFKGLHPSYHRMIGSRQLGRGSGKLNLGVPMVGTGTIFIVKITTHPFQKLRTGGLAGNNTGLMDHAHSAPPFHLFCDALHPIINQKRMPGQFPVTAVAEQDYRIGILQHGGVIRPAVGI